MSNALLDEIKRWTAPRRATLVLQILRGETTANEVARKYDLKPSDILAWKDAFLACGECSLNPSPNDEPHEKNRKNRQFTSQGRRDDHGH